MTTVATRINKYLSELGFCSRREADRLIAEARVTVNGQVAETGQKVTEDDTIAVDGTLLVLDNPFVYLAFNKPVGITSTTDLTIKDNIIAFINYPTRIFHVGRLDKDSEGLILMTNDGDIVNKILRAEHQHEKEYVVQVHKPITRAFLEGMRQGVPILERVTQPCKVKQINAKTFNIILTEGLNRQIRRMCQYFGYRVTSLKRIRIMHIHLDVPVGTYRALTDAELETLFAMIR
ncbi:MAG: pseudouridine synthase [Acholeplasmatales bacterium]|nr:MAG: pseudouridine synthase [Acholeplasmatales bacterium]